MKPEHSENQLADALTDEPVIFMGCTTTEILTLVVINIGIASVVGILVAIASLAISSSLAIILGSGLFFGGAFGLTMFALGRLQSIKEQHGDHYYKEWIHLVMSELGFADKVLNESARYSRGRSL
ncbi:DUF3487 family protein [Cellvibrio sp. ARAG 10.3]|uniref:DUF3487 family protein n=1 Tax=Cellvibrio sp. ARAG 10.3 TaxID=3451358 RepID=UPI003F489E50